MLSTSLQHTERIGFLPSRSCGGILWEEPNQPYVFCSSIHLASLSGGGLIEKAEDADEAGLFQRIPPFEPWCQEDSGTSCCRNCAARQPAPLQLSQLQFRADQEQTSKRRLITMVCGRISDARHMNRNESATLLFTGEFSSEQRERRSCCGEDVCDCFRGKSSSVKAQGLTVHSSQQSFDFINLLKVFQHLRTSGWYYEGLNMQESVQLLSVMEVGTFLIRDSSDSRYHFSLSLHTSRGPTSVRIHYKNGQFSLDSDNLAKNKVPSFPSVHDLVSYYAEEGNRSKNGGQVWLDGDGQVFGSIVLRKPLVKSVCSLKHLCRLSWNKLTLKQQLFMSEKSGIPPSILDYLTAYPYKL